MVRHATASNGVGSIEGYVSPSFTSGPASFVSVPQALPPAAVGTEDMIGARDGNGDPRLLQGGGSYSPALRQPRPRRRYEAPYYAAGPSTPAAVYPAMGEGRGRISTSRAQAASRSTLVSPRYDVHSRDDGFSGEDNPNSRYNSLASRDRHARPREMPFQEEDEYSRDYPSDHLYTRERSGFTPFPRYDVPLRDAGFSAENNNSSSNSLASRNCHARPRDLPFQEEDEHSRDYPSDHFYRRERLTSCPRLDAYARDDGFSREDDNSRYINSLASQGRRARPSVLPYQEEDDYSRDHPSEHSYTREWFRGRFEAGSGDGSRGLHYPGTPSVRARVEPGWRHVPADYRHLERRRSTQQGGHGGYVQQLSPQDQGVGAHIMETSPYYRDNLDSRSDSTESVSFVEEP